MDRAEAKKMVTEYSKNMTIDDFEADTIIDVIYGDFESRVCDKCKHFIDNSFCDNHKSLMNRFYVKKTDGCNKFARY